MTPKGPRRIQTEPEGTQRTPKGTQRCRKPEKTDENPLQCPPVFSRALRALSSALKLFSGLGALQCPPVLSSSSVLLVLSSALSALQCSQCSPVLSSALHPALQCSPTFKTTPQRSCSRKRLGLNSKSRVALISAPVCTRMYILGFALVYIYMYI